MLRSFVMFENEGDFKKWFNNHANQIIKGTVNKTVSNDCLEGMSFQMLVNGLLYNKEVRKYQIILKNVSVNVLTELLEPTLTLPAFS